MAIYPDKKAGVLTGRFRVEMQHGSQRYRKRHDSLREAQGDEKRVRGMWARGETVIGLSEAPEAPKVHTLLSVSEAASSSLWVGDPGCDTNWAHLRAISKILGDYTPLNDLGTSSVDKIVKALRAAGKANGTINRYLSHLRTLLVWAKARKYYAGDVKEISFDWQKESAGRIRWITTEEEAQLKEFLPEAIWKLVKVGIETGCRRDEIINCKADQIDGDLLHVWVTKADLPRTVPMEPETTQMLRELVDEMPTRRNLRSWWNRAKDKMGLADDADFVFHCTRHTRATRLVDAGVDILIIKELLGHKRIETTLRYAHVRPSNLIAALKQVREYNESSS